MTELCYVVDKNDKPLDPTNYNNGWRLVRKGKAEIVSRYPFVIRLNKGVLSDTSKLTVLGIDTGSKFTGVAVVQECTTKNKVLFKGTIQHRQDVSKLMEARKGYRRYRRSHKRYRPVRFSNRASSTKLGRIAPSIKTSKDEILRVAAKLAKYLPIHKVIIEDVAIDIRVLQEGYKLYSWQYLKSNRLDENLRKAVLMRDNHSCKECGKTGCKLEVHHIVPRRLKGANTLSNLITLCSVCHANTVGTEMHYAERYQALINGKSVRFDYAQRAMQGKNYLRQALSVVYPVELTTGGDTANKRIDWAIEKSHSNDAVCLASLCVADVAVRDWVLKPLRTKTKAKQDVVAGFKHRDLIQYTKRDGTKYVGYITALDGVKKTLNFTTLTNEVYKRYGFKNCKLMQRFSCVLVT